PVADRRPLPPRAARRRRSGRLHGRPGAQADAAGAGERAADAGQLTRARQPTRARWDNAREANFRRSREHGAQTGSQTGATTGTGRPGRIAAAGDVEATDAL